MEAAIRLQSEYASDSKKFGGHRSASAARFFYCAPQGFYTALLAKRKGTLDWMSLRKLSKTPKSYQTENARAVMNGRTKELVMELITASVKILSLRMRLLEQPKTIIQQ